MTIRTRLTVWYSVVLLAGLGIVTGWAYYEMFTEHPGVTRELVAEGHTPGEEIGEFILYAALPALALALVSGWFLMRRALSPITRLTQAAEHLNTSNLNQQLSRTGNGDELDRLTEVFNDMTHRLDESFQRIREFTLHASHELKTPLSLMRNELDAALHEENLSASERQRVTSLLEEIERLTHIVDGLMFLTKADTGLLALEKTQLRLDELVRDAADDAEVLAHPHQIQCRIEVCEPVSVAGDRRRLRQLLLILTDNAVKYNHPGGRLTLALRRRDGHAELTVTNTGPGIPQEQLERVFDRFFRGDPSHNREVEGCGLGLTIAQRLVQAHGGEIFIESNLPRETSVVVHLPALEIAAPARQPVNHLPHERAAEQARVG
ncbi:MAG TPA: ATP-binding protein [Candidatus Saccharimonadales bacterium]|nr:ATP-binding protein [Candidatus Saccharimonadales bacterium]